MDGVVKLDVELLQFGNKPEKFDVAESSFMDGSVISINLLMVEDVILTSSGISSLIGSSKKKNEDVNNYFCLSLCLKK